MTAHDDAREVLAADQRGRAARLARTLLALTGEQAVEAAAAAGEAHSCEFRVYVGGAETTCATCGPLHKGRLASGTEARNLARQHVTGHALAAALAAAEEAGRG